MQATFAQSQPRLKSGISLDKVGGVEGEALTVRPCQLAHKLKLILNLRPLCSQHRWADRHSISGAGQHRKAGEVCFKHPCVCLPGNSSNL